MPKAVPKKAAKAKTSASKVVKTTKTKSKSSSSSSKKVVKNTKSSKNEKSTMGNENAKEVVPDAPVVPRKTDAQLDAIFSKIDAVFKKSYWSRNTNDSISMIGWCTEYLTNGRVFTVDNYNTLDSVLMDSYSYRSSGIQSHQVCAAFVEFYKKCDYPASRMPKIINKAKNLDLFKIYLEKNGNSITLEALIDIESPELQAHAVQNDDITVEYDQTAFDKAFKTIKTVDSTVTISPAVFKMIVDTRQVELTTDFVKMVAIYSDKETLEYVVVKGGMINANVLEAACKSTIDRKLKIQFILCNKVIPEKDHFDSILESTTDTYYYRGGKRQRNYNRNHTNDEEDAKECIEELINSGYNFTYENMLECLRNSIILRNIERFSFKFDEKYMIACAKIGTYPYNVDIKPTMGILEAECDKGGNLTSVRKTYNQIKKTPSEKCMENACKYKNNIATIKFLKQKGCQFNAQCVQNIANAVGNRTLCLAVDGFVKQIKDGQTIVTNNPNATSAKEKATKDKKVNKVKTDESDEDVSESESESNSEEIIEKTSLDAEVKVDQNLENELEGLEDELIGEGVDTDNITHFKPIPTDFDLYTKVYDKLNAKMMKALKLNAKSKNINFMDLIILLVTYCSEQKMVKGTQIEIDEKMKDFLQYKDVTKVNMDDIQRWVYALVIEGSDNEGSDEGSDEGDDSEESDDIDGSGGGGVVKVTTKAKSKSKSKTKTKAKKAVPKRGAKAKAATKNKKVVKKTDTDTETEDTIATADSGASRRSQPRKRVANKRATKPKAKATKAKVTKATKSKSTSKTKGGSATKKTPVRRTAKKATKPKPKRAMVKGKSKKEKSNVSEDDLVLF
jgi:hypothetical protein